MQGFGTNIEKKTIDNETFRTVLYTTHNSQLVVMHLGPHEEIGDEVHGVDQFLRCEKGTGKAVLDGKEYSFCDGDAVVVPAGTRHNILNTSDSEPLKLYTMYAPPNHLDGIIHQTKKDAEAAEDKDHFDGKTSDA